MPELLGFANEVLDNIVSHLRREDLLSFSLCSCRTYNHFLANLYHDVEFDFPKAPKVRHRTRAVTRHRPDFENLDKFLNTLRKHPDRVRWVISASFTWAENRSSPERIISALQLLSSLRSVRLQDRYELNYWRSREKDLNLAELLNAVPLTSLEKVELDLPSMSMKNVAQVMLLPALDEITISSCILDWGSNALEKDDIPDSGNVRRITFLHSDPPDSTQLERLLKNQTQLKSLAFQLVTPERINPGAFGKSLEHLRHNLLELQLTTNPDKLIRRALQPNTTPLDLSMFSSLKSLKVNSHLFFTLVVWSQRPKEQKDWTSYHTVDTELSKKLPKSLESLCVLFETGEYAFKPWELAEEDHKWVIALAQHKISKGSQLSKVKIVEKRFYTDKLPLLRWSPTSEVRSAFEDAMIGLEVWLRKI